MATIKCIATDFDYTLAHFTDRVENGLFDIFRRRGVPEETIRLAYDGAVNSGFSIEKFAEMTAGLHGKLENGRGITQEFESWLARAFALYPDSLPFLCRFWGKIPIAIITQGDQLYQRQKIYAARIPYDDLRVVTPPQRKIDALRELLDRYGRPLLFLEDKPDELDAAWHRLGPENAVTALALRDDSPYNGIQPRYNHIRARSLERISALLEE